MDKVELKHIIIIILTYATFSIFRNGCIRTCAVTQCADTAFQVPSVCVSVCVSFPLSRQSVIFAGLQGIRRCSARRSDLTTLLTIKQIVSYVKNRRVLYNYWYSTMATIVYNYWYPTMATVVYNYWYPSMATLIYNYLYPTMATLIYNYWYPTMATRVYNY